MKKSFFIILIFPLILFGQNNPYELNWKLDGPLLGGVFALSVGGVLLERNIDDYTIDDINALDINNVPFFDRFATKKYSSAFKKNSDILFFSSFAMPFSMINKRTKNHIGIHAVMTAETILLTSAFTGIAKIAVQRPRPLVFNSSIPIEDKLSKSNKYSFFSGHTSLTATSFFYTAQIFSDYFPESKWKPLVWTIAATIPAIVGFSRVYAGKHYPSDVIVGYLVGAGTGMLIPRIHRTKKKNGAELSFRKF